MSTPPKDPPIFSLLSNLYGTLDRGALTGEEAEWIHWALLHGDDTARHTIKRVLDKLSVLESDRKKGRITAKDVEHLRRPLLAMIASVFPQQPPDPAQPSSAGQPTTKLMPPGTSRWHYLVITSPPGSASPTALQALLDQYGTDGWEFVACQALDGQLLLIFKRAGV